MSYYPHPDNGHGGQDYWYDDYDAPAHYEQGPSRHQQPPRARPSQQYQQQQQQQHQYQQQPDPRMRFPRRQAFTTAQSNQSMEQPRNLYDGSDYGDPEEDQWPLSSQAAPTPRQQPQPKDPRQNTVGARNGPPVRPQRPDELPRQAPRAAPANHPYQQPSMHQQQPPRSAPANHQPPYVEPQSQPSHHGTGQWTGDGYSYSTPATAAHGYPIAQQASYNKNMPPRPPLGPPPSSRRGPSSYYSQQLSPVHPIVEEAERASLTKDITREGEGFASQSRASLTSSNAIPIGIPRFYLEGRESGVSITPGSIYSDYPPAMDGSPPRKEEPLRSFKQRMQEHQQPEEPRDTVLSQQPKTTEKQAPQEMNEYFPPVSDQRASAPRDDSPSNVPVRQASLGKRSKPTLTTVKSGDRMRKSSSVSKEALAGLPSQQKRAAEQQSTFVKPTVQSEENTAPGADYLDESPVAPRPGHGAGFSSSNDSSSESAKSTTQNVPLDSPKPSVRLVNSKETLNAPKATHQTRGRSPLARNDVDDFGPHSKETLSEPEKSQPVGLARKDSETLKSPTAGYSGLRTGRRRPPRLDIDTVRDEEARGSLTSLSDLIKRATRLASNLDRGRTASRLGMEHWLGNSNENNNSSELGGKYRRSNGSLSGILASFPPPGAQTPSGSLANWSSRRQSAPLPSNDGGSQTRPKQRRCCGIPLWLFILLCVLLLVLVAAAVVIPIVLVVLPNQNEDSSSSSSQSQATGTQASVLSQCAATLTCENGGQAFPTTESNDDSCKCLCVNSYTGPTCSSKSTAGCSSLAISGMSENATIGDAIPRLFTLAESDFDLQLDARAVLGLFNEADLSCAAENALVSFDGKAKKQRRSAAPQASETTSVHPAEATSNGVVFDSRPSPSKSSDATSSPSPSASSTSTPAAKVDVDFARAAVLYILQETSSLEEAESAQKALQENLEGGEGGVVTVGDWKVDLTEEKVTKE